MIYTIKFNLDIDDDNIATDDEIKSIMEQVFESINAGVSDVKVIDIND